MFGYVVDPEGYAAVSNTKEFEDLINENPDDIRRNLLSETSVKGRTYMNKYPGINGKTAVNNIRVIRLSDIYLIAAEAALKDATSVIASAGSKGIFHKNNAARKVSRLTKLVNGLA